MCFVCLGFCNETVIHCVLSSRITVIVEIEHCLITMEEILHGILKYRQVHKVGMVKQFRKIQDHPEVNTNPNGSIFYAQNP